MGRWRTAATLGAIGFAACRTDAGGVDARIRRDAAIEDRVEPPSAVIVGPEERAISPTIARGRFTKGIDEHLTADACPLEHEYREWLPTLTTRPKAPPPRLSSCDAPSGCATVVRQYVELSTKSEFGCRCNARIYWPVLEAWDGRPASRGQRSMLEPVSIARELEDVMDAWLCGIDYVVNYDGFGVLDITFRISGMGAYPDTQIEHRTFDVERHRRLRAKDVFVEAKLGELVAKVNVAMDRAIAHAPYLVGDDGRRERVATHERLAVTALDDFVVLPQGVTFFHLSGLPHVVRVGNAMSEYPFSYAGLADFLRPDGPLAPIVRQSQTLDGGTDGVPPH